MPGYTEKTVTFHSGVNSVIEIYAGLWANGDTWLQLDDVSLTRGPNLVGQPGFEQQSSASATSPWYTAGRAGIDRNHGFTRSGANNAWVRGTTGWKPSGLR